MDDNKNKLPYVKPTIRPLTDPSEEIRQHFETGGGGTLEKRNITVEEIAQRVADRAEAILRERGVLPGAES